MKFKTWSYLFLILLSLTGSGATMENNIYVYYILGIIGGILLYHYPIVYQRFENEEKERD